jgi:carbamoyl-phosphate synthase large subunit
MEIVYSRDGLADYLRREAGEGGEILLDRFLEDAIEVDVDALCDGDDVWIGGVMQHVEEAGVHSGDSPACCRRTRSARDARADPPPATREIALALGVRRADQRAVRDPCRRALRDRGQPARVAHGAVRLEGDRRAAGQARLPASCSASARRLDLPRGAPGPGFGDHVSSRRPCCRSTASPAPTRCSARRCARPARSWASPTTSRPRSPRRRPRPARRCRARARSSSPSPTPTRPARSSRSAARPRLPDRRHPRHGPAIRGMGVPVRAQQDRRRARRTSSTGSKRGDVDLVVNTPTGVGARTDGYEIRRAAVATASPA